MLLEYFLALVPLVGFTSAQGVGNYNREIHPKLQWNSCSQEEGCQAVDGEVVVDANWRWLREKNGYRNCFDGNQWTRSSFCNSTESCTENCVYEGADYKDLGVRTANDSISLQLKTRSSGGFGYSVASRMFLMENRTMYKTFTPLNNELAFDVDLSTVECGINSALYFVSMDADGGVSRFPGNKAGAEYGVGYCDSSCSRNARFIGGEANYDGWMPSETDEFNGEGMLAACCSEFDVWNSNAHSYEMATKTCSKGQNQFRVCNGGRYCDPRYVLSDDNPRGRCDPNGCSWNTYRISSQDFYGKGKLVNTSKKFTVVTRFELNRIYQFFIQDGRRIDVPEPRWTEFGRQTGITPDMCSVAPNAFNERDRMAENGGWDSHVESISKPMVMAMSINVDHWACNLWLDSLFPLESEGAEWEERDRRGPCPYPPEENCPATVLATHPNAKVTWSNIRFGPIGSTVKV